MRRDANADVLMMKWMRATQLHDASYQSSSLYDHSIENRVHPLPATGRTWVAELHLDLGQQSDQNLSFSQMGSLNMFLEVKNHNNTAKGA